MDGEALSERKQERGKREAKEDVAKHCDDGITRRLRVSSEKNNENKKTLIENIVDDEDVKYVIAWVCIARKS